MALIRDNKSLRIDISRRQEPIRLPPTQRQLSRSVIRLMEELAAGRVSPEQIADAQDKVYGFAEKSVSTAWSAVDAAILIVRAFQGRRKVSRAQGDVVGAFRASLEEGKRLDLDRKGEIVKELKLAEGDAKAALETELKELTLRGIPEGRPMKLGPAATQFLVDVIVPRFRPVKGSPLALEDLPNLIVENLRFFDFMGKEVLFSDEEKAAYAAARDEDKAARANADASEAPAEETDAIEESNSDEIPAEEEAPAVEDIAQSA